MQSLSGKAKRGLDGGWGVAERGWGTGDAGWLERVGEVEEGDIKGVGGDGGSLKKGGDLVGVDVDEAAEEVDNGGEGILPDDIVEGRLRGGCFEGGDGFFAGGWGHAVRQGEKV